MSKIKLNHLIEKRYSPRAYDSKPIPKNDIDKLFEAARWAASSRNTQPWRFIYATPNEKETWNKLYDCLIEFNQQWVKDASLLMLVLGQKVDPVRKTARSKVGYQIGLAMGNFTTQASDLGIYLRNMGGFSPETAISNFHIPDIYEPIIMVAGGYPVNENELVDNFKVPKGEVRERRTLDQLIYDGNWDKML